MDGRTSHHRFAGGRRRLRPTHGLLREVRTRERPAPHDAVSTAPPRAAGPNARSTPRQRTHADGPTLRHREQAWSPRPRTHPAMGVSARGGSGSRIALGRNERRGRWRQWVLRGSHANDARSRNRWSHSPPTRDAFGRRGEGGPPRALGGSDGLGKSPEVVASERTRRLRARGADDAVGMRRTAATPDAAGIGPRTVRNQRKVRPAQARTRRKAPSPSVMVRMGARETQESHEGGRVGNGAFLARTTQRSKASKSRHLPRTGANGKGATACGDTRTAAVEGNALEGMCTGGEASEARQACGDEAAKPGGPHDRLRDATSSRALWWRKPSRW
jgi:hypothetical protein